MPTGIYIRTKPTWNKGLTKETDERIRKIGEKIRGRKYPKNIYPNFGNRNKFKTIISKDELYQKYIVEQKSIKKIAKEYNIDYRTIHNRLSMFNIPFRKQGRRIYTEMEIYALKEKWKHPSNRMLYTLEKLHNSRIGSKHKNESKQKMSETRKRNFKEGKIKTPKGMLGKHLSEESKQGISKTLKEKFKKGLIKPYERFKDKNPAWLGGISFEPYGLEFNEQLKEQIRTRDNFTCQLCGLVQNGYKLAIHHIDYNKKNYNSINLITLCRKCHIKTNLNRIYWTNFFQQKLEVI